MGCRYSYRFTEKAEQDFDEILRYISLDLANPAAAQNLGRKMFEQIDMVRAFPDSGAEGISKVNIFTDLCIAGADTMRDAALSHTDYLKTREMRVSRINAAVKQKIRLFGSDGKY